MKEDIFDWGGGGGGGGGHNKRAAKGCCEKSMCFRGMIGENYYNYNPKIFFLLSLTNINSCAKLMLSVLSL